MNSLIAFYTRNKQIKNFQVCYFITCSSTTHSFLMNISSSVHFVTLVFSCSINSDPHFLNFLFLRMIQQ